MNFERPETPEITREQAVATVHGIMGEVMRMGANDSEMGDFQSIIARLHTGELAPRAAVAQAEGIRDGKQAYH